MRLQGEAMKRAHHLIGARVSVRHDQASIVILNLRGRIVAYHRHAGGRFIVRGHLTDASHVYAGCSATLVVEDAVQVDDDPRKTSKVIRRLLHDAVDDFCN